MKNVIKFFGFIIYSTSIFFLPNNRFILLLFIFNILVCFWFKIKINKVVSKSFQVLPFIAFTFVINFILDNFYVALWVGIKLLMVCNITIIYSETTSVARHIRNNKNNMFTT